MAKITLPTVNSTNYLSQANENFALIAAEFQDKAAYRDNPPGETNTITNDFDMDGNRVFNLPQPLDPSEAARLQDVQQAISGLPSAALIPFTPSGTISASTVQGAIQELDTETQAQFANITSDLADFGGADGANEIGWGSQTLGEILKDNNVYTVPSIAALKLVDSTKYTIVRTLGYYGANTGGGGYYYFDPADVVSADNGGLIHVGLAGARWKIVKDGFLTAEQFGVIGGGGQDDYALLQNAIDVSYAAGYREIHLTNPAGYKINTGIIQPVRFRTIGQNQLIRCEDITPLPAKAWRIRYTNWAESADRWAMQTSMENLRFQGHAAPNDGVYTNLLDGISMESYHMQINNVTCVGFGKAFTWNQTTGDFTGWLTWETKLKDCVGFYNRWAIFSDFSTAGGLSGAGITIEGGTYGHNDHTIYNNAGEITFLDCASDAPVIDHVENNITALGGNEIGFMHWQNSRIEAGGSPGIAWITNTGTMRFKDCFFIERVGAEFIFATLAGGTTTIDGGTWRSADGRYKAAGAGNMSVFHLRPVNITNGALLNSQSSCVLNNDMAAGTTAWGVGPGTATLGTVADAGFLLSGVALTIAPTVFPATVSSTKIELVTGAGQFQIQFRSTNPNATVVPVTIRQYNRDNVQINATAMNVPNGAVGLLQTLKVAKFQNAAYAILDVAFVAGQVATFRFGDVYMNQW